MKIHLITVTYELRICCVLLLDSVITKSNILKLHVAHVTFSGKTIAFLSGVVPNISKLRFVF